MSLNFAYKTDQAEFTFCISFLPSNHVEKISPARIRTEYRPENFEYEYFSCNENLVLL